MGKRKKVVMVNAVCWNENSIRECDVILLHDPTVGEENIRPLPSLPKEIVKSGLCPSNFTWCRLGCVCDSLNSKNLDIHIKHCRDTGFSECIFGCECGNLKEGQQLQTYKQLTFTDKSKKLRWQDDDECGFVPPGSTLNLEDGRPKRKSQPPERFRHDVGGEKAERAAKKARSSKEPNGKKTGRPRRYSGDQKPLPIRRRNRIYRSCSTNVQNYAEDRDHENQFDEDKTNNKQKSETSSARTYLQKKVKALVKSGNAAMAISTNVKPSGNQEKTPVIYGQPLSVVELEHESELIFMIVRADDGKQKVISFVEWTNNLNFRPSVSFIGNFLHSKKIKDQNDCSTIIRLPFEDTKNIGWYFYDIPENYVGGLFLMFPNLHAIISTALLQQKIETHKPKEEGEICIINISDINSNKHEKKELEGSVYLLLEYDSAIVMGTSPPFYRKPKGEIIYVPGDGSSNLGDEDAANCGLSPGSPTTTNGTSATSSEEDECDQLIISDHTDAEESDSGIKIS